MAGDPVGPSCSNGAVGRLQVTPDGRFAAFITTSNVTAYDSHGFAEMYRYDAETEKIQCVSCRPDGSAPNDDVLGSEGGRFLTDDGRVFFDTTEPLEPRDTNAGTKGRSPTGSDVYEFVDGRPQLITHRHRHRLPRRRIGRAAWRASTGSAPTGSTPTSALTRRWSARTETASS